MIRRIPGARLVILGRQGAGKGTQCVRLAAPLRRAAHLHRRHAPRRGEGGHATSAEGEGVHGRGRARARRRHDRRRRRAARSTTTPAAAGYILDGFPRTAAQAEALDEMIGDRPLDLVIDLEVPRGRRARAARRAAGCARLRHQLLGRRAAHARLDLRRLRRRGRPARRRHRGGHRASGSTSTTRDRAAHRRSTRARASSSRSTASGRPTRCSTRLIVAVDDRRAAERRTMLVRSASRQCARRRRSPMMRRAGRVVAEMHERIRDGDPPGRHDRSSSTQIGRDVLDRRGASRTSSATTASRR